MTKIEQRKAEILAAEKVANEALLNNDSYVNMVVNDSIQLDAINAIDTVIRAVNKIDPIISNAGDRFIVNCYSVATGIFGEVVGRILGLVNVSGAMFTDERQKEFYAITGVPYITWANAAKAFGNPAYFSKGIITDETDGDVEELKLRVQAILIKMGLASSYAETITESNITKYFLNRQVKATKDEAAYHKAQALTSSANYTIED